jgi:hypothetical protein
MANPRDVFLGGTCSGSKWRHELIDKFNGSVTFYNPVIEGREWTLKDQEEENKQKKTCEYMLFVITPKMQGFYSIAEVVESSFKKPGKTIFCVVNSDEGKEFDSIQKESLRATGKLLQDNKAIVKQSLEDVANFLNHNPKPKSKRRCTIS